jgi:hypothetical protein
MKTLRSSVALVALLALSSLPSFAGTGAAVDATKPAVKAPSKGSALLKDAENEAKSEAKSAENKAENQLENKLQPKAKKSVLDKLK